MTILDDLKELAWERKRCHARQSVGDLKDLADTYDKLQSRLIKWAAFSWISVALGCLWALFKIISSLLSAASLKVAIAWFVIGGTIFCGGLGLWVVIASVIAYRTAHIKQQIMDYKENQES